MCTVLLPPGVNPTAVNKYIISYTRYGYVKVQAVPRSKHICLLQKPNSQAPYIDTIAVLSETRVEDVNVL